MIWSGRAGVSVTGTADILDLKKFDFSLQDLSALNTVVQILTELFIESTKPNS